MKAADLRTEAHGEAIQGKIDELADGGDAQLQERVARRVRQRQPVEAYLTRCDPLCHGRIEHDRKGDTPLFLLNSAFCAGNIFFF